MSRFLQRYALEPPVLVWTVGKVASSSIYATLKQSNIEAIHVHYLSDELVSHQLNWMYAGRALPLHMVASLRFLHAFQRDLYKLPIKIITLVRDPLARNISAYFENLKNYGLSPADAPVQHVENFLTRYHHGVVYDWFDDELQRVTGIDYRKLPFDAEEGWCIYRDERFELLVLRAEETDTRKLEAVSAFLGRPFKELVRANEGMSKSYNVLYQTFKDALVLPRDFVNEMYAHPFCRIFWSRPEIAAMRMSWNGEASRSAPALQRPAAEAIADDVRSSWSVALEGFDWHAVLKVSGELNCESARVSVGLYDPVGRLVTRFEPREPKQSQAGGPFSFTLSMADLPLNAGVYNAALDIVSNGPNATARVQLAPLVISESVGRAARDGLLATAFKWEQHNPVGRQPKSQ